MGPLEEQEALLLAASLVTFTKHDAPAFTVIMVFVAQFSSAPLALCIVVSFATVHQILYVVFHMQIK